jgi:tyrosyl-tRNA synthetase
MTKLLNSTGEVIRIIKQGGIKINHEKITNPNNDLPINDGDVLRVGKLNFFRIKIK